MELYLKGKTKLIGAYGTRLLREIVSRGDLTGASAPRRLPGPPGKRVPEVEINISIL
ncbi:hypothetical protein FB545_2118 [Peribacillus frigoritolerans]|nr:hypothetical protein [Peribacillus frigoritolerans]TWD99824.1 hypothetical protein FB545_2118 [Peribacillus frigoritolerans]